jgi:hypothetical protein
MRYHLRTIIALLIISILGLISISWFKGNFLITDTDFSMPTARIKSFESNFYLWDLRSLGASDPRVVALTVPLWALFAFSETLGLSLVITESILFYAVFTISGLSMYYLTNSLLGNKTPKFRTVASFIAAIFYMFNPYLAINILPLRQVSYIIYAFLPLIFALFVKGLSNKGTLRPAIFLNFSLLVITMVFVDPSFVPLVMFPLILFFIFYLIIEHNKSSTVSAVKFLLASLLIGLLLNFYWIIPDLNSVTSELANVANAYGSLGYSFQSVVNLNSAPLSGAFRLLGYWALNSGYKGVPYITWSAVYSNTLFIFIGFLLPILAFTPLLLKRKDKHVIFFAVLALVSLLLINASYSPIGSWIYSNVPLFAALFNTPYLRFGMFLAFAYAFLLGYVVAELWSFIPLYFKKSRNPLRRMSQFLLIFSVVLIIGVYSFPIWTGNVIYPGNAVLASNRYAIPEYYYSAANWLNNDQTNFRLLQLPYSIAGYGSYNWPPNGYSGPDLTESLLGKSLVSGIAGGGMGAQIAIDILNGSSYNAGKALALMNVKYLVVHRDANWEYIVNNRGFVPATPEQIESALNNQADFTLVKSFGQLDFYLNNFWQPMGVYAASSSILSGGDQSSLIQDAQRADFNLNNSIVLLSSQLDGYQVSNLPIDTVFVQTPDLNMTYKPVSAVVPGQRLVYALNSEAVAEARYYSGWKGIISTTGKGDGNMIVYPSPIMCPYLNYFPNSLENWSSYDSTLVYVASSTSLTINDVTANGTPVIAQAWWQTGTSWVSGWPVTIPARQDAIIQVAGKASTIGLQTNNGSMTIPVADGWKNPLTILDPAVTRISTPAPEDYLVAINPSVFGDGNVSVKIDNQSFAVDLNMEQGSVSDYKYVGPVYLAAGLHSVSASDSNGTILQLNGMLIYSLNDNESFVSADSLLLNNQQNNASISYQEFNPTLYAVHVNCSNPIFLVFTESYDNGWVATINGQQISSEFHFTANGYANCWYVNETGDYTITLEFTPQNLFYAGGVISITTLILCTVYLGKNKIKTIYQKHVEKKVSN